MTDAGPQAAFKKKRLMYVCINSSQDKIRTLYKNIILGRKCIVICHDDVRAQHLANVLNELHQEQNNGSQLAMMVDGSAELPPGLPCLIVSACGAALTEDEAADYDTFVMHDNPTSKEQYKNWVWHSYCTNVISFLVNEPEEQNLQENYLLDQIETFYKAKVEEFKSSSKKSSHREKEPKEKRDKHKRKDDALLRLEEKHKDETEKLTQLLQQLIIHQQVQAQKHQQQQQEQKEELEQQIKSLQSMLKEQHQHMEQQRQTFEAQLRANIPELASGDPEQGRPDNRPRGANLPTGQRAPIGAQHMQPGPQYLQQRTPPPPTQQPVTPNHLPSFNQFTSANADQQARMLQEMQQYALQMQHQYVQRMHQQGGMYAAQQAAGQAQYVKQPIGQHPLPSSLPQPPFQGKGQSAAHQGIRPSRGGKGTQQGAHPRVAPPRWATVANHVPNNPFGQAQTAPPSSAKVQELARIDNELEMLQARLQQRTVDLAGAQNESASSGEPGHGIWIPGQGYVTSAGKGLRNRRGTAAEQVDHIPYEEPPFADDYGPVDPDFRLEEWETSEKWEHNASSY